MYGKYLEFVINGFIEFVGSVECGASMIISMSLYIGLCVYTNGMVDDLKCRMHVIDEYFMDGKRNGQNHTGHIQLILVEEIRFHHTIIR